MNRSINHQQRRFFEGNPKTLNSMTPNAPIILPFTAAEAAVFDPIMSIRHKNRGFRPKMIVLRDF